MSWDWKKPIEIFFEQNDNQSLKKKQNNGKQWNQKKKTS